MSSTGTLCACGCGRPAPIARKTSKKFGHVAGKPTRFITGHNGAKSPVQYIAEDRGFKTPCWIWQRATTAGGYGCLTISGRRFRAHRVFWQRANGPIPPGLDLDHLCRQPACVNPDHLEPVTRAENIRRGLQGPRLTAAQVAEIRAADRIVMEKVRRLGMGKRPNGSLTALREKYGVSYGSIYKALA